MTEEIKEVYYKRVSRQKLGDFESNVLLSAYIGEQEPSLAVVYELNKWVCPKANKLFVFQTFQQAKGFICGNEVYECKVINPQPAEKFLKGTSSDGEYNFLKWLRAKILHKKAPSISLKTCRPSGSVAVDAVMLTKKVWPI